MSVRAYVTVAAILILPLWASWAEPGGDQTSTNRDAAIMPPATIAPKSPVDFFRELLAMTPSQRVVALSNRPPENQKMVLVKVREYLSLSENERELRLRATELHWRMLPLMRLAPTNRAERLASIPEQQRQMVASRLADWDKLSAGVQQQLLTNQESIRLFIEREAATNGAPMDFRNLSEQRRRMLEQGIEKIKAMPPEQQQQLLARFNQFFKLSPEEQDKALKRLTEPEREKIEKNLAKFWGLTPAQRTRCIQSFEKFSRMSLAERQQFLKNADRWNAMKPEERQAWRNLVENAQLMPPDDANALKPPMQSMRTKRNVVKGGNTN